MRPQKKIFFCIVVLVFGGSALTILLISSDVYPFCQKDLFILKRNSGDFLKLPEADCSMNTPFLVILVTSRLGETEARMAIRQSWGKERVIAEKRIVTYFLLGNNFRSYEQIAVATENTLYKDIIQKDFLDTYYNLTLKTLMGLEWIHKFCPQSTFVMKTDSDMFVNTYYLTELLLKRNRTSRFFTGLLRMHDHPVRDPSSKWYVNEEEYPGNYYPPFASGTGYVLSTDVASQIYVISKKVPFFKLEDVFIGLCLSELKIQPRKLHSEPTFFSGHIPYSPCRYKKIITSHYTAPSHIMLYWDGLEKSIAEECPESQEN
ncbi:beta-1,3-galactosyltransferase 5-like [Pogona vitticeps]